MSLTFLNKRKWCRIRPPKTTVFCFKTDSFMSEVMHVESTLANKVLYNRKYRGRLYIMWYSEFYKASFINPSPIFGKPQYCVKKDHRYLLVAVVRHTDIAGGSLNYTCSPLSVRQIPSSQYHLRQDSRQLKYIMSPSLNLNCFEAANILSNLWSNNSMSQYLTKTLRVSGVI